MAVVSDPQETILNMLRQGDKPQHEAFDDTSVAALVYALSRGMQRMAIYGRSISSLLLEVRDNVLKMLATTSHFVTSEKKKDLTFRSSP